MGPEAPPSRNPGPAPVVIVWAKKAKHTWVVPALHFEMDSGAPELAGANVVGHNDVFEQPMCLLSLD